MKSAARREKDRARKQRAALEKAETRRLVAIAEAERIERDAAARERAEEAVVSAVLRHPVVTVAGVMLVGARIQVIDGRPARVDPLAAYRLTMRRRRAGHQLQADWREVGGGVGVRAVDYLRSGGGGTGDGGHAALVRQIATKGRLDGALTAAGAFAPFLARVVLDGVPLAVAVAENPLVTDGRGWLDAALGRLADFYWPVDVARKRVRVLAFGPARETYLMEVADE